MDQSAEGPLPNVVDASTAGHHGERHELRSVLRGHRRQHAQRRHRHHPRRSHRGDERCRLPRAARPGRATNIGGHYATCCRRPKWSASSTPPSRRSTCRTRRAAAQVDRPGHRLHAVADRGEDGEVSGANAVLQGPDPRRAARGARAAARPPAALGEMAAAIAHEVKKPLAGIEVMAACCGAAWPARAKRRRCSPTSSTKPRWPTPSSSRCSTSCGRSACRSSRCRSRACCTTLSTAPKRWCRAAGPRCASTCPIPAVHRGRRRPAAAAVHEPGVERVEALDGAAP